MTNHRSSSATLSQLAITLAFGFLLVACYDPNRPQNLNCSAEGLCPGSMECHADNICRSINGTGDDSDARPFAVDAAPEIDAVPVECSSTDECQSPPDLCHLPGVCDIDSNLCVFPKVACDANETCATHQCNPSTGECETTATNEDAACQTQSCTSFGACNFDDGNSCDESGSQARSCTDYVCTAGACVGTAAVEMQNCSRVTDGDDCNGGTSCGPYGACAFESGVCDESGTETRSCTDNTCADGVCAGVARDEAQACTRVTEGQTCDFRSCQGGGGGGGGIRETCCSAGSCNDPCGICEPLF